MSNEYKNISVRLNNEDYSKLEALTDFFNANSYFKGSFADTLRIAVDKAYNEVMLTVAQQGQEVKTAVTEVTEVTEVPEVKEVKLTKTKTNRKAVVKEPESAEKESAVTKEELTVIE
jgi:hypothetical protein